MGNNDHLVGTGDSYASADDCICNESSTTPTANISAGSSRSFRPFRPHGHFDSDPKNDTRGQYPTGKDAMEIYHVNTSDGMATGGSDEWSNFIAIDLGNSQESLGNVFGHDRCGGVPSLVSPTDVTNFASATNGIGINRPTTTEPLEKWQVAQRVCQLLGLPRGAIAESHLDSRGRMLSSNTEQKLRRLLEQKDHETATSSTIPEETIAFTADRFLPTSNASSAGPNNLQRLNSNTNEDEPDWHKNILTEGEYYLAMSMLVYIYSLLREAALLGHTNISFDEIDANSSRSADSFCAGHKNFWSKTKSAGFLIRVVVDELEKSNGSIIGKIGQSKGDMSIMKEFQRLVMDSSQPQVDAATEETMKQLRRKVARRRWKRAISAVRLVVRIGKSSSNSSLQHGTDSSTHSKNVVMPQPTEQGHIVEPGRSSNGMNSTKSISSINLSLVKNIARDALDGPRFFREGSLMGNLIESGIEVVWIDDHHPDDIVYGICVNRQKRRVSVVFREEYPGREDKLGFHTGFALYLLRQRKDTDRTKMEEIFMHIASIGRELDGDFELSITGHSLGGALATILAFYAAASNKFSNVKSIRAFTYAAPRTGCQRFAHAFQHLEKVGKLRVARFSNTCDIVPLVPFWSSGCGFGRPYKHVGMHIRMKGMSKFAQYSLRQALDVTYPKNNSFWAQLWRGLRSSLVMNLNTVQGYMKQHSLSQYQRQINFANKYRSALSLSDFFRCEKRHRLKTLDEYYFIKGASSESGTATLTKIFLDDREKKIDRQKSRKIVFGLILIILTEAAVLFCLLRDSSYSPINQHMIKHQNFNATTTGRLNFPGEAMIKSFASIFTSKIKFTPFITYSRTQLASPKSNFSIALPYLRKSHDEPRQHIMPWGVRLAHHKMPTDNQLPVEHTDFNICI